MISHYALYDIATLSKRFDLTEGLPKGIKPHYNNSPTIDAPVIVNREGTRIAKLMKWGLVANGAKDTKLDPIGSSDKTTSNASETSSGPTRYSLNRAL